MSPERPALPSLNNWLLTTEIATAPYFPILNALMSEISLATSFFFPTCQSRVLNTVMRTIFKNTFNKIIFCLEVKIKRPLPFLCPPLRSMCLLHHGEWLHHTHHSTCPALPCWPPPAPPTPRHTPQEDRSACLHQSSSEVNMSVWLVLVWRMVHCSPEYTVQRCDFGLSTNGYLVPAMTNLIGSEKRFYA